MKAHVRLMQDDGVSGPQGTIDVPDDHDGQDQAARAWAAEQVGHPWDVLTIEYPSGVEYVCRGVTQ